MKNTGLAHDTLSLDDLIAVPTHSAANGIPLVDLDPTRDFADLFPFDALSPSLDTQSLPIDYGEEVVPDQAPSRGASSSRPSKKKQAMVIPVAPSLDDLARMFTLRSTTFDTPGQRLFHLVWSAPHIGTVTMLAGEASQFAEECFDVTQFNAVESPMSSMNRFHAPHPLVLAWSFLISSAFSSMRDPNTFLAKHKDHFYQWALAQDSGCGFSPSETDELCDVFSALERLTVCLDQQLATILSDDCQASKANLMAFALRVLHRNYIRQVSTCLATSKSVPSNPQGTELFWSGYSPIAAYGYCSYLKNWCLIGQTRVMSTENRQTLYQTQKGTVLGLWIPPTAVTEETSECVQWSASEIVSTGGVQNTSTLYPTSDALIGTSVDLEKQKLALETLLEKLEHDMGYKLLGDEVTLLQTAREALVAWGFAEHHINGLVQSELFEKNSKGIKTSNQSVNFYTHNEQLVTCFRLYLYRLLLQETTPSDEPAEADVPDPLACFNFTGFTPLKSRLTTIIPGNATKTATTFKFCQLAQVPFQFRVGSGETIEFTIPFRHVDVDALTVSRSETMQFQHHNPIGEIKTPKSHFVKKQVHTKDRQTNINRREVQGHLYLVAPHWLASGFSLGSTIYLDPKIDLRKETQSIGLSTVPFTTILPGSGRADNYHCWTMEAAKRMLGTKFERFNDELGTHEIQKMSKEKIVRLFAGQLYSFGQQYWSLQKNAFFPTAVSNHTLADAKNVLHSWQYNITYLTRKKTVEEATHAITEQVETQTANYKYPALSLGEHVSFSSVISQLREANHLDLTEDDLAHLRESVGPVEELLKSNMQLRRLTKMLKGFYSMLYQIDLASHCKFFPQTWSQSTRVVLQPLQRKPKKVRRTTKTLQSQQTGSSLTVAAAPPSSSSPFIQSSESSTAIPLIVRTESQVDEFSRVPQVPEEPMTIPTPSTGTSSVLTLPPLSVFSPSSAAQPLDEQFFQPLPGGEELWDCIDLEPLDFSPPSGVLDLVQADPNLLSLEGWADLHRTDLEPPKKRARVDFHNVAQDTLHAHFPLANVKHTHSATYSTDVSPDDAIDVELLDTQCDGTDVTLADIVDTEGDTSSSTKSAMEPPPWILQSFGCPAQDSSEISSEHDSGMSMEVDDSKESAFSEGNGTPQLAPQVETVSTGSHDIPISTSQTGDEDILKDILPQEEELDYGESDEE